MKTLIALFAIAASAAALERIPYQNPGLVVDLGVGLWAWPMPMDWDGDGDLDLLVACPDKPYNGVYLFENPEGPGKKLPVFRKAQRLGPASADMVLSMVSNQPRIFAGRHELPNFRKGDWKTRLPIFPENTVVPIKHPRDSFWRLADFDGDGNHDLLVGHGDWTDFGWFDKNEWWKHFNWQGVWTGAPLHGRVWWLRNEATDTDPKFAAPQPVMAGGRQIDVFGRPGQNLADFDGDGDLDLLCGEFLDGFTYFENTGTRSEPRYAQGRRLTSNGRPVTLDLEMIVPHAIDWDRDGDIDLIVGDEDGRVALVEHTGRVEAGLPIFEQPRYFQQEADDVKCGALATPVGVDWDGDGDTDLVSGNTAGYIEFFENLSGANVAKPKWAAPHRLEVEGKPFRIMAGPNGSPQGPCEAKWGYTTLSVADWDVDGLPDIVLNSIWGRIEWLKNIGTRSVPRLAAPAPVRVTPPPDTPRIPWHWWTLPPDHLVTQWRTTPVVVDWNQDGLPDLLMLDGEGYLAFFERRKAADSALVLLPGRRAFVNSLMQPLQLNTGTGGKAGRRKLSATDWDGDGKLDLLLNSSNANFLRQIEHREGLWLMRDEGPIGQRNIEGHDVSPTTVDWDGNGIPDLLGGAEDGRFYHLPNPRANR